MKLCHPNWQKNKEPTVVKDYEKNSLLIYISTPSDINISVNE